MLYVLVMCPVSGDLVPSGLKISSLNELDDNPQFLNACLACGANHVWEKWEATLTRDGRAVPARDVAS